ncbi:hypothetical protein B8V81_2043 [Paenibacillus pasadenensis]|uniref:Uncharacterized protein n=1 Tax=Paenibacillus pasadenensis TaxID=217090 RepID=A0A2N5MZX6_9BACL|nr:hypothetical protein B8V81_2043 [Paenibacillus pasadenensis]
MYHTVNETGDVFASPYGPSIPQDAKKQAALAACRCRRSGSGELPLA